MYMIIAWEVRLCQIYNIYLMNISMIYCYTIVLCTIYTLQYLPFGCHLIKTINKQLLLFTYLQVNK